MPLGGLNGAHWTVPAGAVTHARLGHSARVEPAHAGNDGISPHKRLSRIFFGWRNRGRAYLVVENNDNLMSS